MMIEYLSIIPTISRCPECMFGFLLAGLRIVTPGSLRNLFLAWIPVTGCESINIVLLNRIHNQIPSNQFLRVPPGDRS
jgi:hypothetical protein